MVATNADLEYENGEWVYYIYVRVKNVYGRYDHTTVYCELVKYDLSAITKKQVVYLQKGEEKVVTFAFYTNEYGGKTPAHYNIYGEA